MGDQGIKSMEIVEPDKIKPPEKPEEAEKPKRPEKPEETQKPPVIVIEKSKMPWVPPGDDRCPDVDKRGNVKYFP
ncbi:unnamed protein product [Coffea canephora]|uniref:DH200=94 genomic scaffold, scaffold_4639 n=1 Tax=Coffea canephora TaxID=49390 RepID=A0A068VLM8_COFCA|nr:unnamed protein product [Coffea canephora]